MLKVVAVLESMWDYRSLTSAAGYTQAPRYFKINPQNYSGKRLYKLIGPNAQLLVTNACKELVSGPQHHGTPDPVWLAENLALIATRWPFDLLLVCGKIAQRTFDDCTFDRHRRIMIVRMPHPAARTVWTADFIDKTQRDIQAAAICLISNPS